MWKPEYNVADFQILLFGDTIVLNSEFKAMINVPKTRFLIKITEPAAQVFEGNNLHQMEDYRYTTTREGLYNFTGTIKYDSAEIPFAYKFVVVKP